MCLFVSGTFHQRNGDGFLPTATGTDKVSVHAQGAGKGGVPAFRHQLKTDGLKLPGTGLFGRFWAPFLPLRDFRL